MDAEILDVLKVIMVCSIAQTLMLGLWFIDFLVKSREEGKK